MSAVYQHTHTVTDNSRFTFRLLLHNASCVVYVRVPAANAMCSCQRNVWLPTQCVAANAMCGCPVHHLASQYMPSCLHSVEVYPSGYLPSHCTHARTHTTPHHTTPHHTTPLHTTPHHSTPHARAHMRHTHMRHTHMRAHGLIACALGPNRDASELEMLHQTGVWIGTRERD